MTVARVEAKILVYEIDESEAHGELIIASHWNNKGWDGYVVLDWQGKKITVAARDLIDAAERCKGLR